jgi:1,4-alpha-glucan branching enzyme
MPSERAMDARNQDSPPPGEIAGTTAENRVRYVFTVSAEDAEVVCLAGDFNQWRVCEAPLERVGGDTWSIAVELPPGRHEYMFVIDGKWVTDPRAMGFVKDGFGNTNAVVVV